MFNIQDSNMFAQKLLTPHVVQLVLDAHPNTQ